uniref:BHLH domain-containing protein n=1 Tax=Grammatophora oceanica TaxID=210454 RepID=A0A7S1URC8_9STRA|mmetsp:Transcript_18965/g.28054  ORF Transcript_18965/g.28054 Transcript_18965/m.28054 type:complete len:502 (+) Transcript_18965:131-1636(+)
MQEADKKKVESPAIVVTAGPSSKTEACNEEASMIVVTEEKNKLVAAAVTEAEKNTKDMLGVTKENEKNTSSFLVASKRPAATTATSSRQSSSKRSKEGRDKEKKKNREQNRRREFNRGLDDLLQILVRSDTALKAADQMGLTTDTKQTGEQTSDATLSHIDVLQRTANLIRKLHQENQQLQTSFRQQLEACRNTVPTVQQPLHGAPPPSQASTDSSSKPQQQEQRGSALSMPMQSTGSAARTSPKKKNDVATGLESSFQGAGGRDSEKSKRKRQKEQHRRSQKHRRGEVNRGLDDLLKILVGTDPVLNVADQLDSADPKRTVETSDVALSRIDVIQRTVGVIRQLHQENQELQTFFKQQLLACSNIVPSSVRPRFHVLSSHAPTGHSSLLQRHSISMPAQSTAQSTTTEESTKSNIAAELEASFLQAHRQAKARQQPTVNVKSSGRTNSLAYTSHQTTVTCSTPEPKEMLCGLRVRTEDADSDDYQADDDDSQCSTSSMCI